MNGSTGRVPLLLVLDKAVILINQIGYLFKLFAFV